ncbi:MAG: DUF3786 domain-containing protein [Planctomycetota bacterium]|jgi:hypothetical protein
MAHEGLWEQLLKLDTKLTEKRADCHYICEKNQYLLEMLNKKYVIDLKKREIFSDNPDSEQQPPNFLQQLCLLAYLINSQDLPLAGVLVRAEELPSGQFFFRGLHRLPTEKLKRVFGSCPQRLYEALSHFDAEKRGFGDASIELRVFARVPLTIVIWRGDDEFDARASLLFDRTASSHLPLDALLTAVKLAVDALVEICEQE